MASGAVLWGKSPQEWAPWPSDEVLKETALRIMSLATASARVRPSLMDYLLKTPDWFDSQWLLETQVYAHMHSGGLVRWLAAQSVLSARRVPLALEEAFDAIPSLRNSEAHRKVVSRLLEKTAPGQPLDPPSLQAILPLWEHLEDMVGEWWQESFG